MTSPYPIVFSPILVPKPWGGKRIPDVFYGGTPSTEPIGEAWIFSTIAGRSSTIVNGDFSKFDASDILGTLVEWGLHQPVLIKLLDAVSPLSLQVHPSDEWAQQLEGSQFGKTEAWYVLASDGARVFHGIKTSKTEMFDAIRNGTFENDKHLNSFSVQPRDVVPIQAGTVHATEGSLFVLEVQQPTDYTYRIYDYGRTDRELHLDKADAVIVQTQLLRCPQPSIKLSVSRKLLWRCHAFVMEELLTGVSPWSSAPDAVADWRRYSCDILVPLDHSCGIIANAGKVVEVPQLHSVFLPQNLEYGVVSGAANRILKVSLPLNPV